MGNTEEVQVDGRRIWVAPIHDWSKFDDSLRSKTPTAQINEALCKILCHNLCCLIQSMFELNIKPEFWNETPA